MINPRLAMITIGLSALKVVKIENENTDINLKTNIFCANTRRGGTKYTMLAIFGVTVFPFY